MSANTDGIVVKPNKAKSQRAKDIIKEWEQVTGFEMELNQYLRLNSANVNNYVAIKADGKAKRKGWFGETGLQKNAEGEIIMDAIVAKLRDGTPIAKTITECTDIRKFVCIKTVSGGAAQGETPLGKVVRWYYSSEPQPEIQIVKTGGRVGKTMGGKPMMELEDQLPNDIAYDVYIQKAEQLLEKLAYAA